MPCDMAVDSRVSQPLMRWEWVNSHSNRDFPTPGSPATATILPVAGPGSPHIFQLVHLAIAPDERRQATHGGGLQSRAPDRTGLSS